ncbi:hypothetical protein [Allochromatium warmingii]|uniref:hypothetical protein n=1 Tax=Allochromatium warmingii TaxID=61595 RepID=UPI0015A61425|nr:hypothetical protein [Allochromatium warmingii]
MGFVKFCSIQSAGVPERRSGLNITLIAERLSTAALILTILLGLWLAVGVTGFEVSV